MSILKSCVIMNTSLVRELHSECSFRHFEVYVNPTDVIKILNCGYRLFHVNDAAANDAWTNAVPAVNERHVIQI